MIAGGRARLLDLDPELGSGLAPEELAVARQRLIVRVERVSEEEWRPGHEPREAGHLGFLLAEGVMVREVAIGRARGAELLTPGDLLRPSQEDSASFVTARWRVLRPIRLAELSGEVARALGRYPTIVDALLGRVMLRARSQAARAAIESVRSLDEKLLTLLWQLAERHGARTAEGVSVPLSLTHQILADLVGARRPSVTVALRRLAEDRQLTRDERGWLLAGELPPELLGGDGGEPATCRRRR
jgi:CRP/FNR family transcriptional regulator, cyclic AMP receptor protein